METIPAKAVRLLVPLIAFILFALVDPVRAQSDAPSGPVTLSQADLQQLVAPIALYPDPLIALILPASTVPTDIVLAERYLNDGGDADDIDDQSWDANVKGLARYPDVLQMMSDNLDWTNQLGAAVLYQQDDVMAAIQAQRAKAQALGNLTSTPQQQVVTDNGVIEIYPADPQIIYVPVYDPQVVYVQTGPYVTFGPGFNIGIWIGGGCDWRGHRIYSRGYYRPGYGWRPGIGHGPIWRPNPGRPKPRPPYHPGRPGHLPGVRPPPNRPRPPGGNRPGISPLPGHPRPSPGNGGSKPGHGPRPNPGTNPPGRPNRPSRPEIQPVPQKPGPTKPGVVKPDRPVRPAPGKPSMRPTPGKPSIQPVPQRPSVRPAPERPVARPARPDNSKRPEARPAPSRPPQASRPQSRPQSRPAAPAGRPSGGGNGRGNGSQQR